MTSANSARPASSEALCSCCSSQTSRSTIPNAANTRSSYSTISTPSSTITASASCSNFSKEKRRLSSPLRNRILSRGSAQKHRYWRSTPVTPTTAHLLLHRAHERCFLTDNKKQERRRLGKE